MSAWVYVDESKRAGYVLVAVSVADPPAARKMIRGLVLPGQRRLHMVAERPGPQAPDHRRCLRHGPHRHHL
ncbi:MAG: hypothetical protein ACRDZQ_11650 [Acidimicrobiales bacterium]